MRWRVIFRNIFSNWASYIVTAIIGFLLSPFILHSLKASGYGLWTLVLSLTGYFGLLDLGIRSSVGRFVSRYMALKDDEKTNRTVSAAFAILCAASLLAIIGTLIVALFFFKYLHVDPEYQADGRVALLITGATIACALPFGVFSSVLVALERFDILSGVTIVSEVLRAGLIVFFLKAGHGLTTVALIAMFCSITQYSAMAIAAKRQYPALRVNLKLVDRDSVKELFGFGIYRFVWIVANQLIFYSDSIVIGVFLSTSAITTYAIAGSLVNYGRTVMQLVTDPFYPAASRMDAQSDTAGLRNLLISGTRLSLLVSLPLCAGLLFLGKQFITLWMGAAYAGSAFYLVILTIPQITGMTQYMSALVLAGMAKHRMLAYLMLMEGAANLLLSVILIRKIGLVGVAWGTVIPDLICTAIVIPLYTLSKVGLSLREYLVRSFLRPLLCVVPGAALAYAFSVSVKTISWALFGGEVALICASVALMAYLFCLESSQRAMVHQRLRRIMRRSSAIPEIEVSTES